MGGGRGSRLYPLTKDRCKPAVPLAGNYRLVDIPISNCLNSGFNQIFVLTQFNTASLHKHIQQTYKFDGFGRGFVDILAAEQTRGDLSELEYRSARAMDLMAAKDRRFSIVDVKPGQKLDKVMRTAEMETVVDPRAEWRQMFQDAYRFERDFFYDPGLHKVDWKAMRDRYRPLVAHVHHRADLTHVIGEMISELPDPGGQCRFSIFPS